MDHRLIEGLMEAIAPLIKNYVDERLAKEVAPLQVRINEYESREPLKGDRGNDADPEVTARMVSDEIARFLPGAVETAVLSKGVAMIESVVAEKVEKAVSDLPVPVNGKDADPVDLDEVASRA